MQSSVIGFEKNSDTEGEQCVSGLNGYVCLSHYAGMREDLVQAGGGNSAYKISADRMLIKASGYQLSEVTEEKGYAVVDPQIIREAFLRRDDLEAMTEEESKAIIEDAFIEGARPSIETFLHSISGTYSLHTHPVVVNALACRKEGEHLIRELFPDSQVVPYATPGVELAKAYFKEYKLNSKDQNGLRSVFLMNHGLLVSAETAEEVMRQTEQITRKIEDYLGVDHSAYHDQEKIQELYEDGITWLVSDKNIMDAYGRMKGKWKHAFCPDCVVFLGKAMYKITTEEPNQIEFHSFVERNGYPVVVLYKDSIYIHAESVKKAMEIQSVLSFSAQVMEINDGVECSMLTEEEKNFLLHWDAEKYRRNLK